MRNAVSEIKRALGVVGQKTSFIGVVTAVDDNGRVTVIAGDREEVVPADGGFDIGDEVIVEGGIVVGLAERADVVVWIKLVKLVNESLG